MASPIIFSIFINDLVTYLHSKCDHGIYVSEDINELIALMFADDVSSFSDTIIRLQRQINLIKKFCKSVDMKINLDKTKIIVFRNGGVVKQIEKWTYCGENIDIVSSYKYLGVYLTPKLLWSKTQEMLALQSIKSIACIFRYQRKFGHLSSVDIFKVFDAMIKPILCYGSEIWGYSYVDKIEKVQIQFCKQYCNLPQNTPDILALGECGRLPLCITYMSNCIKFWLKITRMENHRYPNQCYKMLKDLDDAGRRTWASHIRELLFSYGFGYVWFAQGVGHEDNFIHLFKTLLQDCYLQVWKSKIHNSPKALH